MYIKAGVVESFDVDLEVSLLQNPCKQDLIEDRISLERLMETAMLSGIQFVWHYTQGWSTRTFSFKITLHWNSSGVQRDGL
jgi:hypothetical protein